MKKSLRYIACAAAVLVLLSCSAKPGEDRDLPVTTTAALEKRLHVGDVIFVRISTLPFKKIAKDTNSWTNHVGIITEQSDKGFIVSESTVPTSRATPLSDFLAHSECGRVAVKRLKNPLTPAQQKKLQEAAKKRYNILYDTGFDIHSNRQFCSRYVYESLYEATGVHVGEITKLSALFKNNPDADIAFWDIWYLGAIPWDRETITPASMLISPHLRNVFDGYIED